MSPAQPTSFLPRLRGTIEEGDAGARLRAHVLAAPISPTLPSPASGGGNPRRLA
jgi:hypothetical protein